MDPRLTIESEPAAGDLRAVRRGLQQYNRLASSMDDTRMFGVFLRDADGQVRGGVEAASWGEWLEIAFLWVDPAFHRQGYGSQLLRAAESEGRHRGCRWAQLDTYSFQAPEFYRRHGYEPFGVLDGFPGGVSHFYLKKRLADGPA